MSKKKSSPPPQVVYDDEESPAGDDLHLLKATRGFWARRANTYLERTNMRIQLMHHVANQQIATQTQRECMALFTLALITVIFLPGTFVAASVHNNSNNSFILSTSFFNYGPGSVAHWRDVADPPVVVRLV